jgi:serine protease Do
MVNKMLKFSFLIIFTFIFSSEVIAAVTKIKNNGIKEGNQEQIKIDPSPKQLATNGFADIVEEILPAVVNISATQEIQGGTSAIDQIFLGMPKSQFLEDFKNQIENQFRDQQGQKKKISSIGSGFVISKDGFIVTNHHVIDDADEITVNLHDGQKYKAKVIGIDKKTDTALLKINNQNDLKFLKFGDSTKSRIGDWVIVIGNPYGLGGSVSIGIVSARGRDINNGQSDDFLQTDAAINRGNSGGPMLNTRGEVVGVSTAIVSPSGGNVGIGFARPSSIISQVVKQLKDQGEVTRGWLGVSVQEVTEEIAESLKMEKLQGAFVVDVLNNSPAEKAGILPTDIITKFEDQEINDIKSLPKAVSKFPVGKIAKITLLRRGKVKNIDVRISKMKDEETKRIENKSVEKRQIIKAKAAVLGLGLVELNSQLKKERNINSEGLLIVEILAKSEASEKGIMIGDVILSVNQVPINSIKTLKENIEDAKKNSKKVFLFISRNGDNYVVSLDVMTN